MHEKPNWNPSLCEWIWKEACGRWWGSKRRCYRWEIHLYGQKSYFNLPPWNHIVNTRCWNATPHSQAASDLWLYCPGENHSVVWSSYLHSGIPETTECRAVVLLKGPWFHHPTLLRHLGWLLPCKMHLKVACYKWMERSHKHTLWSMRLNALSALAERWRELPWSGPTVCSADDPYGSMSNGRQTHFESSRLCSYFRFFFSNYLWIKPTLWLFLGIPLSAGPSSLQQSKIS